MYKEQKNVKLTYGNNFDAFLLQFVYNFVIIVIILFLVLKNFFIHIIL